MAHHPKMSGVVALSAARAVSLTTLPTTPPSTTTFTTATPSTTPPSTTTATTTTAAPSTTLSTPSPLTTTPPTVTPARAQGARTFKRGPPAHSPPVQRFESLGAFHGFEGYDIQMPQKKPVETVAKAVPVPVVVPSPTIPRTKTTDAIAQAVPVPVVPELEPRAHAFPVPIVQSPTISRNKEPEPWPRAHAVPVPIVASPFISDADVEAVPVPVMTEPETVAHTVPVLVPDALAIPVAEAISVPVVLPDTPHEEPRVAHAVPVITIPAISESPQTSVEAATEPAPLEAETTTPVVVADRTTVSEPEDITAGPTTTPEPAAESIDSAASSLVVEDKTVAASATEKLSMLTTSETSVKTPEATTTPALPSTGSFVRTEDDSTLSDAGLTTVAQSTTFTTTRHVTAPPFTLPDDIVEEGDSDEVGLQIGHDEAEALFEEASRLLSEVGNRNFLKRALSLENRHAID